MFWINVYVSHPLVDEFLRKPNPQFPLLLVKYPEENVHHHPKEFGGRRTPFVSPRPCENLDRKTIKRK